MQPMPGYGPMAPRLMPQPQQPNPQQAVAPVPGNDPATQSLISAMGLTPDQFKALQSQVPPEALNQAMQLMRDPQFMKQMAEIDQLAREGKISPEQLNQMMMGMAGMPGMQPMAGMPMMMPPGMSDFKPSNLIKTGILATVMGLGSSWAINKFMETDMLTTSKGSAMEQFLRWLEQQKPIQNMNDTWNKNLAKPDAPNKPFSTWKRLDVQFKPDEIRENYYRTYFGDKGHYITRTGNFQRKHIRPFFRTLEKNLPKSLTNAVSNGIPQNVRDFIMGNSKDLKTLLRQHPNVLSHIQGARHYWEISQAFDSSPVHFLPERIQDLVRKETEGGFFRRSLINPIINLVPQGIRQQVSQMLPKGVVEYFRGNGSQMTLQQLDKLAQKEMLLDRLRFLAKTGGKVPDNLAQQLDAFLSQYVKDAKHVSDQYSHNLKALLNSSGKQGNEALKKSLAKALGLSENASASAIRDAMKKEINYKPVWEHLKHSGQKLVGRLDDLKLDEANASKVTLGQVNRHFRKHHIINKMQQNGVAGKLRGLLAGFTKRASFIERNYTELLTNEHQFMNYLRSRKIGPVGRFVARFFHTLRRIFNGDVSKMAAKNGSPMLNRLVVSLGIFGFGFLGFFRSPKESRWASLFENLSAGIGGYLGFQIGQNFISDLGLLIRNPIVGRIMNKRMLGFLPTVGGFLSELLIPGLVVGGLFSTVGRKISHAIFGNPTKIENKLKYEADKKKLESQPVSTQSGLFNQLRKGNTQFPGVVPHVKPFYPDLTPLTLQNVGLAPADIARNELAIASDQSAEHAAEHLGQDNVWQFGRE